MAQSTAVNLIARLGIAARGLWKVTPQSWLLVSIGAGFFVVPNPAWAMLFYLTVLPSQLSVLCRCGVGYVRGGEIAAIALIGWMGATIAWDGAAAGRAEVQVLWVWNAVCTLVFVHGCCQSFANDASLRDRLVSVLIVCGAINALIALARLPFLGDVGGRMPGWAETRHPILGASILGVVVLLSVARAMQPGSRWGAAYASAAAMGLGFIVLSGSRGPLLAVLGALTLFTALVRPRLLVASIIVAAVAVGLAALLYPVPLADLWHKWAGRGDSGRILIWLQSLDAISQRPLFGHGPAARLPRDTDAFPHNLFLSTLFYSGAVGLTALLAVFATAARSAWQHKATVDRAARIALLCHTILSGMTDLSQVIKGPGPIWYIVWLPLVLCLDRPRDRAV